MNRFIQELNVPQLRASLEAWVDTHVLAPDNAVQVGLVVLALALGRLLGPRLRRFILNATQHLDLRSGVRSFLGRLAALSTPTVVLLLLWIAVEAGSQTALFGHRLTQIAASLAGAWVLIRLLSGFIGNELLARSVAWIAWILAALVALGLFDAAVALLDSVMSHHAL